MFYFWSKLLNDHWVWSHFIFKLCLDFIIFLIKIFNLFSVYSSCFPMNWIKWLPVPLCFISFEYLACHFKWEDEHSLLKKHYINVEPSFPYVKIFLKLLKLSDQSFKCLSLCIGYLYKFMSTSCQICS